MLSRITPDGARTVIYRFADSTCPAGAAIDSEGNHIVAELFVNVLSKITASGTRIVIRAFAAGTSLSGITVASPAPSLPLNEKVAVVWFAIVAICLLLAAVIGSMLYIIRLRNKSTRKRRT